MKQKFRFKRRTLKWILILNPEDDIHAHYSIHRGVTLFTRVFIVERQHFNPVCSSFDIEFVFNLALYRSVGFLTGCACCYSFIQHCGACFEKERCASCRIVVQQLHLLDGFQQNRRQKTMLMISKGWRDYQTRLQDTRIECVQVVPDSRRHRWLEAAGRRVISFFKQHVLLCLKFVCFFFWNHYLEPYIQSLFRLQYAFVPSSILINLFSFLACFLYLFLYFIIPSLCTASDTS